MTYYPIYVDYAHEKAINIKEANNILELIISDPYTFESPEQKIEYVDITRDHAFLRIYSGDYHISIAHSNLFRKLEECNLLDPYTDSAYMYVFIGNHEFIIHISAHGFDVDISPYFGNHLSELSEKDIIRHTLNSVYGINGIHFDGEIWDKPFFKDVISKGDQMVNYTKVAASEYTAKELAEKTVKKVIFNYPATIVFWRDGTKTVVKCQKGDKYNPRVGFLEAFAKKFFGNIGKYNDVIDCIIYDGLIDCIIYHGVEQEDA